MDILFVAIATLVAGALAGYIAALVQTRFQFRKWRQVEEKAEMRLHQLEVAYERLDPANSVKLLFEMHQYDAAVQLSSALLRTDPDNIEAYYLRGRAYSELRETEKAVADLRCAARLAPERPEIQLALGLSELAWGNWERAAEAARKAIAGEVDERALAITLLGNALRLGKQYDKAIAAYLECLDIYPKHTPAIDGIGQVRLTQAIQSTGSYDQVIEWYDQCIEANPTASSTFIGRAIARFTRNAPGDREKAFKDVEQAGVLSDWSSQAYESAGRMCLHLAEEATDEGSRRRLTEHTLELFTKALHRSTRSYEPAIRNQISYVHQILGNHEEAIQEARKSVNGAPSFPTNRLTLICALLKASRWQEAASCCLQWLHSKYAAESLATRVWIKGFLCLARLASDGSLDDVRDDLLSFLQELQSFPEFLPMWRWSPSQQSILRSMEEKGDSEELAKGIIALLDKQTSISDFRKTWQLEHGRGISLTPEK